MIKKSIPLLVSVVFLSACNIMTSVKPVETVPPFQVAINAMGNYFQNELTNLVITQSVSGESPTTAIVEIEQTGLQDDSVIAEKAIFKLSLQKGEWRVNNRTFQQKCYENRGHQNYSADPCN